MCSGFFIQSIDTEIPKTLLPSTVSNISPYLRTWPFLRRSARPQTPSLPSFDATNFKSSWRKGSQSLRNRVFEHQCTSVAYEADRNVVTFVQGDDSGTERTADCGAMIIAFTQTTNSMKPTFIPPPDEDNEVVTLMELWIKSTRIRTFLVANTTHLNRRCRIIQRFRCSFPNSKTFHDLRWSRIALVHRKRQMNRLWKRLWPRTRRWLVNQ